MLISAIKPEKGQTCCDNKYLHDDSKIVSWALYTDHVQNS